MKQKLLDAYFELGAFPDALPVLTALKTAGHATAILSNGSPKMLAAAVKAAGLDGALDAVLSVDVIRMYKPRAEVYALVTDRFPVERADVTFVSSNRWDVMGAAAFGFKPVWVNRANNPDEYPDHPPVRRWRIERALERRCEDHLKTELCVEHSTMMPGQQRPALPHKLSGPRSLLVDC